MLFVAEIGLNHEGNFDLALELIRQAKISGADVAKFQLGWRDKPDEINNITHNIAKDLKEFCEYSEIEFMSSIITPKAYELASKLDFKRIKIASRTVVDDPKLCEEIIATGKEVFCSLGFWKGEDFPFGPPNEKLRYIHCVSNYPNKPEDLTKMPKSFSNEGHYGYSDHFLGNSASYLAISRGAKFIEKHLTLNKASQTIRDHTLSITPLEFKELVEIGGEISKIHPYL